MAETDNDITGQIALFADHPCSPDGGELALVAALPEDFGPGISLPAQMVSQWLAWIPLVAVRLAKADHDVAHTAEASP
jgi:hypothetical protein